MALSQSKRENIHKISDKLASPYVVAAKGIAGDILTAYVI